MKSFFLLLILLICTSTYVIGQPVRSALSGTIILDESQPVRNSPVDISDFRYTPSVAASSSGILNTARTRPGVALISSAIIPGTGQAMNGKWGRAAIYLIAETAGIIYYLDRNATARENERAYERYANENWSVLAYAQWLVAYSEANGISNGYEQLADEVSGRKPSWGNTPNDWSAVDLRTIRTVEMDTPFFYDNGVIASEFSHVVQDYGSQQYYELMSKYYQFLPGWKDFYTVNKNFYEDPTDYVTQFQYPWNSTMLTSNFIEGRDRAEEFNNNYRQAGNILKLLLVNHVISALDAYFTVKLKNSRIETQANLMLTERTISVQWHF